MLTFKAHFDGRVLIPDEKVDLPAECPLEVSVVRVQSREESTPALAKLAELASKFPANPDAPVDGAEQHDHYLFGTAKRP